MSNLQKQKILLESLAVEYETRVNKLRKTVSAKRGYLKSLQLDIQKYQKKNEDLIKKINEKVENHRNLTKIMLPTTLNIDKMNWVENDFDIEN